MVTRKYPRFPITMSGTLIYKERFHHTGTIRDLSVKGCRVETDSQQYTGSQVALLLHVPGESDPIRINTATVRWSGSSGIGMEFLTVAPPQQDRLNQVIRQLQSAAPQAS